MATLEDDLLALADDGVTDLVPAPDPSPLDRLLKDVLGDSGFAAVMGALDLVVAIEEEIDLAGERHPDDADLLYHCNQLVRPPERMWLNQSISRSHARELLERVAAGEDTRPATAAEVLLVCSEVSLAIPLPPVLCGLYFRMWAQACPDDPHPAGDAPAHYEAIRGQAIDDLEREVRRKGAVPGRVLDPSAITCGGQHHGEQVDCRFTPAANGRLL